MTKYVSLVSLIGSEEKHLSAQISHLGSTDSDKTSVDFRV